MIDWIEYALYVNTIVERDVLYNCKWYIVREIKAEDFYWVKILSRELIIKK